MKAFKVLLIIVVVLIVLVALLLAGGVIYLNRYVQTPAFKEQVLAAAREAVGSEVKINDISVSLFSGVQLGGVVIANPQGFTGELLTARQFVLRYRLLPLLHRRVQIEELSINQPVITLARNDNKDWNYDKLGAPGEKSKTASPAPATKSESKSSSGTGGLDISLSKLAMDDGVVAMLDEKNKTLLRIDKINLSSAVDLTGGRLSGAGKASIETINVANSLFVRQVATPVSISAEEIKLAPISGKAAGGNVTGELRLLLTGEQKYAVNLQVKDASVNTLMEEAGVKKRVFDGGTLQLAIALAGSGGLPTISGNGRAQLVGGKIVQVPLQQLLATLLQVPDLRELKFDECLIEFTIANNVMQTPVIRVSSPLVQITGKGTVSLEDNSLNHDMTLTLKKDVLAHVPEEVRAIFTDRGDGYLSMDFRVWGPYDSPKTDLQNRILKGAGKQLIEKELQKIFH